jgi:hypothetical protein
MKESKQIATPVATNQKLLKTTEEDVLVFVKLK